MRDPYTWPITSRHPERSSRDPNTLEPNAVTEAGVWKWGVHENPDLPEAFHERRYRMHEFGGESRVRALPSPEKKFEICGEASQLLVLHCSVQSLPSRPSITLSTH